MADTLLVATDGGSDRVVPTEFVPRRGANLMLWTIAAFFVVALVWAALTELDRTIRAEGRIVPSSKLQVVSNLEGGVIEGILVKPGQLVRKGDILIRLSPTMTESAFGSSQASVSALEARVARLNAEVRGRNLRYGSNPDEQADVESSLHSARRAELDGLMAAGQARISQAQRAISEAESILQARRSNLNAATRELAMIRPLVEKQIVPQIDLIKAENQAEVAQNEVAAAEASVSRARSQVAETRAAAAQARSDWMGRAGLELSQAQADLSSQRQQLPALGDRVDRTTIRAPMTGRVNRVLVSTVGGSVPPGSPIVEIVPSEKLLYVESQVRPADIASVRLRQRARVEITAYSSPVFGMLDGRVTSISPDAVLNEKTGESFYMVEVQTTSILRDQSGRPLPIGPGMVANVSLLGDKRSILSYIFTPITRLSETAFRE